MNILVKKKGNVQITVMKKFFTFKFHWIILKLNYFVQIFRLPSIHSISTYFHSHFYYRGIRYRTMTLLI